MTEWIYAAGRATYSAGATIGNTLISAIPAAKEVETVIIKEVDSMAGIRGRGIVKIAGLSGAVAVLMGAYGSHGFRNSDADEALKRTYRIGYNMHLVHSVALLSVPLTGRPKLTGSLMGFGILLFSGSCYYHALTGQNFIRKVTPYGGMLLIAAWLSMML